MQTFFERSPLTNNENNNQQTSCLVVSSKTKQAVTRFLEQSKNTALGGAVIVNHILLALKLMGHKLTIADHQHLEMVLLSYWGLRGGAAAALEVSGLKDKIPDVLAAYTMTESSIIKMLAIASFLGKMPIPYSYNAALQITSSLIVVVDQAISAKALIEGKQHAVGKSYAEIAAYYPDNPVLATTITLKEIAFRSIQMAATTYTAGYALADVFVDAVSPVDPPNQNTILLSLALVMSILGGASVLHPTTNKITNAVRLTQINTGLILLPLVSLMFDYLPNWFANNSMTTGLIALILVVMIPALLELIVTLWEAQENDFIEDLIKPEDIANVVNIQGDIQDKVEEIEDANGTSIQINC